MANTKSVYENKGGQELKVRGENFKMEFDATDGTMYVRMEGAMVSSYRDLTIYDFYARFHSDIDRESYRKILDWLKEHKQVFVENKRLHKLRGDEGRRFRADPYLYTEEARRMIVPWLEDNELDYPEIEDDFVDYIADDMVMDVSEGDALTSALEDVENTMEDRIQNDGLEALEDEDWMRMLQTRFSEHVGREIAMTDYDIRAQFDEYIEHRKDGSTYQVRHRDGRWEVVNTDKMGKPIKTGSKEEVVRKAKQMAENKSPAVLYILDEDGELEDSKLVME